MNRKFTVLFLRLVCAFTMLTFLAGCEEDVNMDTDFSIHLITPGPNWPKKPKKLEPNQQEVLREQPLSDQVRLIIKYGDPEEVKASEYGGSQWMYFSAGKLYKFSPAGRIIEEKTFPGMGTYIKS